VPNRSKRKSATNEPSDPRSPMLHAVVAASAFEELGISVTIQSGSSWQVIHRVTSVYEFELAHGSHVRRYAYNDRCLARARAEGRAVRGEHLGFYDLFVPVPRGVGPGPVLVAGPFAIQYPTSADLIERWYRITRRRARLSDSNFQQYLSETMATLTLEGSLSTTFERMLSSIAALLGGVGSPAELAGEANTFRQSLLHARAAERMWEVSRSLVDDRTTHLWSMPIKRGHLATLGLTRPPEHALVGLLQGRDRELDSIDEALRRHAFQRAIVRLSYERSNVVCGSIGDHGVSLLVADVAATRARSELMDLARRASDIARRFGFRLHAGIALAAPSQSLAVRHRAALAAAEKALSRGSALELAETGAPPVARTLSELRARLSRSVEGRADVIVARFEQFVEAVVVHTRYQIDATRAYLQAGFEQLAEPLLASGELDAASFDQMCATVVLASENATTIRDLSSAYRAGAVDLERAVRFPTQARRDRSVRRALAYIRDHLAEPMTLVQVARVAGFSPDYLSKLLERDQGMAFEKYPQGLRLERARQTLTGSTLSIARVARLSGFKSRPYFQQLFRRTTGLTPAVFRRRERGVTPKARRSEEHPHAKSRPR